MADIILQDTLIVWTEDTAHDLALSFEKSDSCDKIWHVDNHSLFYISLRWSCSWS